jgi:hypothetical protein
LWLTTYEHLAALSSGAHRDARCRLTISIPEQPILAVLSHDWKWARIELTLEQ